ncbi:hypothetical protein CYMTET_4307 [Cymbomonas tetramitiformis]|uniref:Uncharacterized protein n=1 Tax=Cymbomonas tetramitiformis TaxID=36881 RepID=A0AAE0H1M1_9CHLO|nr:hypothetical protein CYMTET_4307 [Cymbomonas tetramitiformis]
MNDRTALFQRKNQRRTLVRKCCVHSGVLVGLAASAIVLAILQILLSSQLTDLGKDGLPGDWPTAGRKHVPFTSMARAESFLSSHFEPGGLETSQNALPRVALVVGVTSAADSVDWRDAARSSWLQALQDSRASAQVLVHFLVGGCPTPTQRNKITKENRLYNDTLVLPLPNCTEETTEVMDVDALELLQSWLQYITRSYRFDYALKAESHVYLRMPVVTSTLLSAEPHALYWGRLVKTTNGAAPYMARGFYAMSENLAHWLAQPPLPLRSIVHSQGQEARHTNDNTRPGAVFEGEVIGEAAALIIPVEGWMSDPHLTRGIHCNHSTFACKGHWPSCQPKSQQDMLTVHDRCRKEDEKLWPQQPSFLQGGRERHTPDPPAVSPETVKYGTHTLQLPNPPLVTALVAAPGPHELHEALYESFRAQTHQLKRMTVGDSSPFGASPFFSQLSDPRVNYYYLPGVSDVSIRRNRLIERSFGDVIMHFDANAYYGPRYMADTVDFMLKSGAQLVKLSAWFVMRRATMALQYIDLDENYFVEYSRCGLGGTEQQPTHKLAHGFSFAYHRLLHKQVKFLERPSVTVVHDDDSASLTWALEVAKKKALHIATRPDRTGVVIQIVDSFPSNHEHNTPSKRLNAHYHLPQCLLHSLFSGAQMLPWFPHRSIATNNVTIVDDSDDTSRILKV